MSTLPALGYSTNLHAAESLADIDQFLAGFTNDIRCRLGWSDIGVDLRLGSQAIAELSHPSCVAALRRRLDSVGARAHSINAFPLLPFQTDVVKHNAYRPDWTEEQRASDTTALIALALALCDDEQVTISTVPGSYRPFGPHHNNPVLIATALGTWAAAAAQAWRQTGRTVLLCLEPEPWCFLESSHDVATFWTGALADHGVEACTIAMRGDRRAAQQAIARHLGICFDTCHTSLAFENQAEAVTRISRAGARIAKCQFSAAPEVRNPHRDQAGVAALRALAEPRFLHQTCAATAGGVLSKVQDLDQLDTCLALLPEAIAVRSHFHIPVFRPVKDHGLSSTIADSLAGLNACIAAGCRHISVETYTWSVLAPDQRDIATGTARELETLAHAVKNQALPSVTNDLP